MGGKKNDTGSAHARKDKLKTEELLFLTVGFMVSKTFSFSA